MVETATRHVIPEPASLVTDYVLRLGGDTFQAEARRDHNRLYIDRNARFLTFDLRRTAQGNNESLVVLLDGVPLKRLSGNADDLKLDATDSLFRTVRLAIPAAARGGVHTLSFAIEHAPGMTVHGELWIDDVRFEDLTVGSLREIFDYVNVQGVTILTHGFELLGRTADGETLRPLANDIRDFAAGVADQAWLLDYDVLGENGPAVFDASNSTPDALNGSFVVPEITPDLKGKSIELVLTFDWAPESNEWSAGWTEAAGDALFNLIVALGLSSSAVTAGTASGGSLTTITLGESASTDPGAYVGNTIVLASGPDAGETRTIKAYGTDRVATVDEAWTHIPTANIQYQIFRGPDLHFIGHSFGAAVTSEAVERLARIGSPVDQVTYLDPHDFDQEQLPVDEAQRKTAWESRPATVRRYGTTSVSPTCITRRGARTAIFQPARRLFPAAGRFPVRTTAISPPSCPRSTLSALMSTQSLR